MKWYTKYLQVYEKPFSEAPQEIVEEVRNKLKLLQSDNPLVTVSLIGYNEEKHLLASLWSLSEMKCQKEGQNHPSFIIVYSLLIVNLFLVLFSLF